MSVDISKLIDADLLDEYHQALPLSNADLLEIKGQFDPAFSPVSSLSLNFSTDEQKVGTWIDGKPIYQKTVSCGALPNNTTKTIPHLISYLKRVVDMKGYFSNSTYGTFYFFNHPYGSDYVNVTCNATNIEIKTTSNMSTYPESYVTILYTKSTDDE